MQCAADPVCVPAGPVQEVPMTPPHSNWYLEGEELHLLFQA